MDPTNRAAARAQAPATAHATETETSKERETMRFARATPASKRVEHEAARDAEREAVRASEREATRSTTREAARLEAHEVLAEAEERASVSKQLQRESEQLAASLWNRERQRLVQRDAQTAHWPNQIADVAQDIRAYARQHTVAESLGTGVPAVATRTDDSLIPLNLEQVYFPLGTLIDRALLLRMLERLDGRAVPLSQEARVVLAPPHEVERSFLARVGRVLLSRFAHPTAGVDTPGRGLCQLRVTAETNGLTVYHHPIYWYDHTSQFGRPTGPISASIAPGLYRFGAEGPTQPRRYLDDTVELPGLPSLHLPF